MPEGTVAGNENGKGMTAMLEKYLKYRMIMSAAGIVIGLILMIWQKSVLTTLIRVMGYVLMGAAAIYLVSYFVQKRQNETQLGYAIAAGGAGLVLVLLCRTIVHIFPVLMGVVLIMNGAAALIQTYNKKYVPLYSKLLSGLLILLGILIVTQPGSIVNMIVFCIGAAFVINGISGLVTSSRF